MPPDRDHAPDQPAATLTLGEQAAVPERNTAAQSLSSFELEEGTRVDRYDIRRRIGEGGMGVVYEAYDPTLRRRVALKFLSGEGAFDESRRRRLQREAESMAQLSHPNVVTVFDVGTFCGRVFVAMEYVDGGTLRDVMDEHGGDWSRLRAPFLDAGRGLAAAHASGLVHRDFKPENVLVDADGRARVTDFGLVSSAGADEGEHAEVEALDAAPSLTRTGAVLGTPRYMAPEQHRGEVCDARADQFAFCVTLHEAWCA